MEEGQLARGVGVEPHVLVEAGRLVGIEPRQLARLAQRGDAHAAEQHLAAVMQDRDVLGPERQAGRVLLLELQGLPELLALEACGCRRHRPRRALRGAG